MEYINHTLEFSVSEPSVVTLGKFDGLHRGHELLMETLLDVSHRNQWKSIAFTFDIPPRKHVNQVEAKVLTTNHEKKYIFQQTGIDYLIECPFTREVMCMEAEAFVAWIVKRLHVKCVVVGEDFHFGHNRAGDYKFLQSCAGKYGYQVIVLKKIQEDGRDISSTFVRDEILAGNIEKANHLLGYEYFVQSEIVHGRKLGRTIGIPTINMILPPEKLLPPNGVYATRVLVDDKWYEGVSNVGCKPTIAGDNPIGVETYIIDFCQDVYGRNIMVQFLTFLRPEMKFDSIDALKHQMNCDIKETQKYYERDQKK